MLLHLAQNPGEVLTRRLSHAVILPLMLLLLVMPPMRRRDGSTTRQVNIDPTLILLGVVFQPQLSTDRLDLSLVSINLQ